MFISLQFDSQTNKNNKPNIVQNYKIISKISYKKRYLQ